MRAVDHAPAYILAGVAVLVAWRLFVRMRRLVGRQKLAAFRAWVSVCLFPCLLLAVLVGTFKHPLNSLSELAGVGVGIALGLKGLQLTKFEATPAGLFYTPNLHIGLALSSLLVGRLLYKFGHAYFATAGFTEPPDAMLRSPVTLAIIGMLAGYYATYAWGLLRWQRRTRAAVAAPAAPTAGAAPDA